MSDATPPPDVTVTSEQPLVVTDDYRTFGVVTVIQGGVIKIKTTADVSIDRLVKKTT